MIDFQVFFSKIKNLLIKIQDFIQENTKKTLIICCALILILLCAVIILCVSAKNDGKAKTKTPQTLILKDEPLIPPAPSSPKGYITNRKTQKNWSNEEIKKWFTLPDENEIQKLSEANDKIISDITGAAQ